MKFTDIRLQSQQFANPQFDDPKALVTWMGAIQAQEYSMAKWAVGIRLKSASRQKVEDALAKGEILRTHVMRPTWHLVAAEDIRWMLKLTGARVRAANDSYAKGHGLDLSEDVFLNSYRVLEKLLEGNKSLTRQELGEGFLQAGLPSDNIVMTRFMARAETEGIVCSGVDKGNKPTYALLEERVPPVRELSREESLACLATRYFQSHSPATLSDFCWWSGLPVTEVRQAIGLIDSELILEKIGSETYYLHQLYNSTKPLRKEILHFLPSFDEYLISYKDRTTVLPLEHHPKAFNTFGTFYPVILHNGQIVGNWIKKKNDIEAIFFQPQTSIPEEPLSASRARTTTFLLKEK